MLRLQACTNQIYLGDADIERKKNLSCYTIFVLAPVVSIFIVSDKEIRSNINL